MDEGWSWIYNSKRWHYFRNKVSLCKRWLLFVNPSEGYEEGNLNSPDNCKLCVKKLKKEKGL